MGDGRPWALALDRTATSDRCDVQGGCEAPSPLPPHCGGRRALEAPVRPAPLPEAQGPPRPRGGRLRGARRRPRAPPQGREVSLCGPGGAAVGVPIRASPHTVATLSPTWRAHMAQAVSISRPRGRAFSFAHRAAVGRLLSSAIQQSTPASPPCSYLGCETCLQKSWQKQ